MTLTHGYNLRRLGRLIRQAIQRCELDLSNLVVLTEAATGAYCVTSVTAAAAGARVYALAKNSKYGSISDAEREIYALAEHLNVRSLVTVCDDLSHVPVKQVNIVTNSGHVRPIREKLIADLPSHAVISLMYEAWEFRDSDVDIRACNAKGIAVAGTNEQHPSVDVFSYLSIMSFKQILSVDIPIVHCQIALICDNSFVEYLHKGFTRAGANVITADGIREVSGDDANIDVIVIAKTPRKDCVFDHDDAVHAAHNFPDAVIIQFWGDIDRRACEELGLKVTPEDAPVSGHMGILPSAVGPDAIVRLQTGGLKVGELLARNRLLGLSVDRCLHDIEKCGYGTVLNG